MVPALNRLVGLPCGTTGTELAEHLRGSAPGLACSLQRAEQAEFAPARQPDPTMVHDLLNGIAKLLRGWMIAVVLLVSGHALAEDAHAPASAAMTPDAGGCRQRDPDGDARYRAAMAEYDSGRYRAALAILETLRTESRMNRDVLAAEAASLWQLGRWGEALAACEQARRLAPRDVVLRQSAAAMQAQLGLSDDDRGVAVLAGLSRWRDRLRPDEWLGLAAMFFAGAAVLAGLRRLEIPSARPALLAAVAAGCTVLLLGWSQTLSSYRPESRALVVHPQARLYRLPSTAAEGLAPLPRWGEEVNVIENPVPGWSRVRLGRNIGYIEAANLRKVW
jgi:tetratricopeptide (TPR) repeat protein